MKKIIALILVAVMLTALASCAKNPDNESSSSSSSTSANNPVTPPEKKELADIISATYEKHPISIDVSTEQLDPTEMDADAIRYLASVTGVDKISEFCVLDGEMENFLENQRKKNSLSQRGVSACLKIARTIADMENHLRIEFSDLREAVELRGNSGPLEFVLPGE